MEYIEISNLSKLRQPYRQGRTPIKLSLTPELRAALESVGVTTLIPYDGKAKNRIGTYVAQKGGYGSSFMQFASELLLALLHVNNGNESSDITGVSQTIKELFNEEELRVVKDNLKKLCKELK